LPAALAGAGLSSADVTDVVLTHMHGDHMDGAVHVRGPVLVHDLELTFSRSRRARLSQRVLRQPLPADVDFRPFPLDGGRFGAFGRSRALTDDGRVIAVDTAGHTAGHVSVICVDDDDRHILLAGDATDTLEQLREVRADAIAPKPAVSRTTMRTILAHARDHPTVYLPSHDPESIARLQEARTL
jgi:glyoxylase-like metal-dependent hydrolase (beta-lactamase superfamily II)